MNRTDSRITLTIGRSSDGPRTIGELRPHGMMLSIYLLWLFITVLNPDLLSKVFLNSQLEAISLSYYFVQYSFLVASTTTLLVVGIFERNLAKSWVALRGAVPAVSAIFCSLGTICILIASVVNVWLFNIGGILSGIGSGLFILMWGSVFFRFKYATTLLNTSLSFCLAYIVGVIFVSWISPLFTAIVALVLPFLCIPALSGAVKHMPEDIAGSITPDSSSATQDKKTMSELRWYKLRCWVTLFLLGIVLGAIRVVSCVTSFRQISLDMGLLLCGGAVISIIVLLGSLVMSKKETSWDHLFRAIIPIIVLGIACVALPSELSYLSALFYAIAFTSLEVLLWVFMASISKDMDISPVRMFGIGFGMIQFGAIIGTTFINLVYMNGNEISFYVLSLIVLLLIVITTFANATLPRYHELKRIMTATLITSLTPDALLATGVNSIGLSNPASALESDKGDEQGNPNEQGTSASKSSRGRFQRKCDKIAETYMLSAREKEVLQLLAKGHKAKYITEVLCVSQSTAKTHINHIYKKMDIHTQQELLKMIEER